MKLRQAREELAAFTRATNGRVDSARTSVAGFGRSEAGKATWAAKKEEATEQFYRPVTRGKSDAFALKTNQMVSVKRVDSYEDEVYISDQAAIKPRALHTIKVNTDKALKQWDVSQRPAIVILSEEEAGNALGKYDPIKNVVYYTPRINEPSIATTAGGKGAVEFHEIWHAKQADRFRKNGWVITSENYGDYLHALCDTCKKNIDTVKITEYNVGDISDYAKDQFLLGRFDEVEAEYMTQKRRNKNGST